MLIPRESLENLRELKFILQFKLYQPYYGILKIPYVEAKSSVKLLFQYYEEKAKSMKDMGKGLKNPKR